MLEIILMTYFCGHIIKMFNCFAFCLLLNFEKLMLYWDLTVSYFLILSIFFAYLDNWYFCEDIFYFWCFQRCKEGFGREKRVFCKQCIDTIKYTTKSLRKYWELLVFTWASGAFNNNSLFLRTGFPIDLTMKPVKRVHCA